MLFPADEAQVGRAPAVQAGGCGFDTHRPLWLRAPELPYGESENGETPLCSGVSLDGRYWARTSDLQLVELALSQLS